MSAGVCTWKGEFKVLEEHESGIVYEYECMRLPSTCWLKAACLKTQGLDHEYRGACLPLMSFPRWLGTI